MKGKFWSNLRKCRVLNYVFTILFFSTYFFGCQNSLVNAENTQSDVYNVRNFNNEPNTTLEIVDGKVTTPTNPTVLRNKKIGESVDIQPENTDLPTVSGWIFKGWKIITPNVKILNVDYFTMPNSDIDIVGTWGKLGIKKSMEAEEVLPMPTVASGSILNSIMTKLAGNAGNIVKFEYNNVVPSNSKVDSLIYSYGQNGLSVNQDAILLGSVVNISVKESDTGCESNTENPVYMWYDNGTIYLNVPGDGIYLNQNSSDMFKGYTNLSSVNLSKFDTSKVTSMNQMFYGCSGITSLDLSKFDTSNVTDMTRMFRSCGSLVDIHVSDKFVTTHVDESSGMFTGRNNIKGGSGTEYSSVHSTKEYAHVDGGTSNPGYFTLKS